MKKLIMTALLILLSSESAMAFPQVATVNGGNEPTDVTNHTVNLPSGIVSGDLLLVFFTTDGTGVVVTFPGGWTLIVNLTPNSGLVGRAYFRRADGTEGATITVTTDLANQSAHTSYRITGHHTSTDPEGAVTNSTVAGLNPDPPNLNPANWDVEDTLWFVYGIANGASATTPRFTADPSSYINARDDISTGPNGVVTRSLRRELASASDDPSAFTLDTSVTWSAATIAIRPAPAGGGPSLGPPAFDKPFGGGFGGGF